MQELADLWRAWPIAGPWHLAPLAGGTNSQVWRATLPDGTAYVLRLLSTQSLPRAQAEFALVRALADRGLPFQVPVPIPTRDGTDIVPLSGTDAPSHYAALLPLLPGEHPERADLAQTAGAAHGLAALDVAFAALPDDLAGEESAPAFGDLARWHPLVPDPVAAVAQLPISEKMIQRVQAILSRVLAAAPALHAALPQQLLHRDYDPSNILMMGERVTAVLDFEFVGRDLRVLDLAVALSWWPYPLMNTGQEWAVIDTFGAAYCRHFPLTEPELRALPAVLRLRDATSFTHRMGRYFAGQESEARMIARVEHTLWREEWLTTHTQRLLDLAVTWQATL